MTVNDAVLTVLKLVLLALIYLFFVRVVFAVLAELKLGRALPAPRPGTAVGAGATSPTRPPRVAQQQARHASRSPRAPRSLVHDGDRQPIVDDMTIGRAAGCAVRIDDVFASQVHARVYRRDKRVLLDDLGSTNGTFLNGNRLTKTVELSKGDVIRIGSTSIEVTG
jgi:hypothetical protein